MGKKRPKAASANGQQRPSPAYFLSLSLENVRCFGPKQTLNLFSEDAPDRPARWTVLLGENGTGKTTVLQALAGFDLFINAVLANRGVKGASLDRIIKLSALRALSRDPERETVLDGILEAGDSGMIAGSRSGS